MLVLVETAAGYALFQANDSKLSTASDIQKNLSSSEKAQKYVKLQKFKKFGSMKDALAAATSVCDATLDSSLEKFLKKNILKKNMTETLSVADSRLAGVIKEKLNISCASDDISSELFRGIRGQLDSLLTGLPAEEFKAMSLGLSHSLCRHKLKFSPEKVDVMIIQSIALLDDLDKELNTYVMRVREWYGWHFPEVSKIVTDNGSFAKVIVKMGSRTNAASIDLSDILDQDTENAVKAAAEISMGTEVSDEDMENIQALAAEVINLTETRAELYSFSH